MPDRRRFIFCGTFRRNALKRSSRVYSRPNQDYAALRPMEFGLSSPDSMNPRRFSALPKSTGIVAQERPGYNSQRVFTAGRLTIGDTAECHSALRTTDWQSAVPHWQSANVEMPLSAYAFGKPLLADDSTIPKPKSVTYILNHECYHVVTRTPHLGATDPTIHLSTHPKKKARRSAP